MTCVPLQRDKPRVGESVKLAEFLLLTTICAKLSFFKANLCTPTALFRQYFLINPRPQLTVILI